MLPPPASYPVAPSTNKITVNNTGDSFLMVWPCTPPAPASGAAPAVAQGDVTIMITDATGLVLSPAPTFKVTVALGTGGTGGTATALYTTAPSALSIAVDEALPFTIGGGTPPTSPAAAIAAWPPPRLWAPFSPSKARRQERHRLS
jgi:hypothetical protein